MRVINNEPGTLEVHNASDSNSVNRTSILLAFIIVLLVLGIIFYGVSGSLFGSGTNSTSQLPVTNDELNNNDNNDFNNTTTPDFITEPGAPSDTIVAPITPSEGVDVSPNTENGMTVTPTSTPPASGSSTLD